MSTSATEEEWAEEGWEKGEAATEAAATGWAEGAGAEAGTGRVVAAEEAEKETGEAAKGLG